MHDLRASAHTVCMITVFNNTYNSEIEKKCSCNTYNSEIEKKQFITPIFFTLHAHQSVLLYRGPRRDQVPDAMYHGLNTGMQARTATKAKTQGERQGNRPSECALEGAWEMVLPHPTSKP
jgi:hypothetical protein